jgi:hypothetical protein
MIPFNHFKELTEHFIILEGVGKFQPLSSSEKKTAHTALNKLPEDNGAVRLKDMGWNVPSTIQLWGFSFNFEDSADKYGKRVLIDPKTLVPTQTTCHYGALNKYIDDMRTDLPIIFSVEGVDKVFAHDHTRISVQILAGRHKIEALHFVTKKNTNQNKGLAPVKHE